MFWKIKNDGSAFGESLIAIDNIDAITNIPGNNDKIRIHVSSGKEFTADKECLESLKNEIDWADILELK